MSVWTLLRYLIGDREAILEIASNRHALWVGLLFVLSAGFAREYDGEDLLHEPWHLFIPLFASLFASFVLFVMIWVLSGGIPSVSGSVSAYASFLGLFWMTAPLAWLYAIPYERFCDPRMAIDLNILTLGLVSLWRVALMIRVACVCTAMRPLGAAAMVLTFGSAAFGIASVFVSLPLLPIMGGLRAFEEKTSLQRTVEMLGLGGPSLLLVLVGVVATVALNATGKKGWSVTVVPRPPLPGKGLLVLACLSLLVWIPILPLTQPEQQRRRQVEKAIKQERYVDAAAMLAETPREAFPPCWVPPPRVVSDHFLPRSVDQVLGMLEASAQRELPEWVGEHYWRRLGWLLRRGISFRLAERLAEALPRIPGGMDRLAEVEADPDVGEQQKRWLAEVRVLMRDREKQSNDGAKP